MLSAGDAGWLLPGVLPRFWRLLGGGRSDEISVKDVDLALARALAQTYLAGEVRVGWRIDGALQGVEVDGPRDPRGRPWAGPAAPAVVAPRSGARAWVPGPADGGLYLELGALQPSPWSAPEDRERDLQAELQASVALLEAMRQTVGTVRERSAVGEENQRLRRVADAELELQFLLFHDRRGLRPWLGRAADFTVRHLAPLRAGGPSAQAEALRLAERLSRRLMHRLLELDGAEASAPGDRATLACARESATLSPLIAGLEAAASPSTSLAAPSEIAQRHALALWVLGGLLRPDAPPPPPPLQGEGPRAEELRLFLRARAHQAALERRAPAEASWGLLLEQLRAHLGAILAAPPRAEPGPTGRARDPHALPSVRAWLRLWLVHELAHRGGARIAAHQRELTGLLVELLRQKVFYGADAEVVAARSRRATAGLVRLHLREVLGLEGADPGGTLALLAQGRPGRGVEDGDQHVDHVLDHYLLGQLLWSAQLRLPDSPLPGSLGGALAHRGAGFAPPAAQKALAQALGFAALNHDAGLAYFPQLDPQRCAGLGSHGEPVEAHSDPAFANAPGLHDPKLTGALSARDAALRGLAEELVTAAEAALQAAGVLSPDPLGEGHGPGGPIPAGPDSPMGRWLAAQRGAGRVDHALSSAFVLYRGAVEGGVAAEVWRPAVRAVLLHGPAEQPVDAQADPVAALLLLLDEALSWEPEHRGEDGSASRTAALALPGLLRAVDPLTGALRHHLPDHAGGPLILQIDVKLGHLDASDAMAFPDWITAAQAVGRVRSEAGGLSPRLRLRGPVPHRLRSIGGTRALLDQLRASGQLHDALDELIAAHLLPGASLPEAELEEEVLLGPVRPAALRRDARPLLRALLQQAQGALPRAEG